MLDDLFSASGPQAADMCRNPHCADDHDTLLPPAPLCGPNGPLHPPKLAAIVSTSSTASATPRPVDFQVTTTNTTSTELRERAAQHNSPSDPLSPLCVCLCALGVPQVSVGHGSLDRHGSLRQVPGARHTVQQQQQQQHPHHGISTTHTRRHSTQHTQSKHCPTKPLPSERGGLTKTRPHCRHHKRGLSPTHACKDTGKTPYPQSINQSINREATWQVGGLLYVRVL